jgi:hypothetical protein
LKGKAAATASVPATFAVAASVMAAAPPLCAGPLAVERAEVFATLLAPARAFVPEDPVLLKFFFGDSLREAI